MCAVIDLKWQRTSVKRHKMPDRILEPRGIDLAILEGNKKIIEEAPRKILCKRNSTSLRMMIYLAPLSPTPAVKF